MLGGSAGVTVWSVLGNGPWPVAAGSLDPVHVHLDPLGGVAGDMFVAAALDAWPDLVGDVIGALAAVGVDGSLVDHHDGVLGGRRFVVTAPDSPHRRTHRDLVAIVAAADLGAEETDRAVGILDDLAAAEAAVHDIPVSEVAFHEIGAWDSLADVVAAAVIIARCGAESWSTDPLPLGGGTVRTQHGVLPVPAPATVLLLDGLPVIDDGVMGERVTPTGAAIVRSVSPTHRPASTMTIAATGHGFGTRTLPDRSNVLRLVALAAVPTSSPARAGGRVGAAEQVGVIEFDIDDQSPEDLAVGLDRIRSADGVIDVTQRTGFGKKGRFVIEIRVLCRTDAIQAVAAACFAETTTLGVRHRVLDRIVLDRTESAPDGLRLKAVTRPDGRTSIKVDMDDLARSGDRLDRERLRRRAEEAGGGER